MKINPIKLFVYVFLIISSIQLHALTTKKNQILNSEGVPIEFKGINWFGFNTKITMVDGLWAGSDSLSLDFATVVYRMQLLGFNAVRLPFSFKDLFQLLAKNYTHQCRIVTLREVQASVTNPLISLTNGKIIPPMLSSSIKNSNLCNDYLPNHSTLDRFLWVINFFAKNGFYVLIDNHLREDQTVLENSETWVQNWVKLLTAILQDPISKDKIMLDLLNEPDHFGIRWEASNHRPGLKDLYLAAMDALYPLNSQILFFIEGTGQERIGANWGDGFVTNPNLIAQYGLSDPNPFFQALLHKPYLNQIVISPHIYPPSVTGASKDFVGPGLWKRLSSSFGYLTKEGYCTQSNSCKIFPIAIGEFGSRFNHDKDLQMLSDFAHYLNDTNGAIDRQHEAIRNWFYWSWSANSGDTGGIVTDNGRDIIWKKIDYLTTLGLKPWYLKTSKN